MIIKLFKIKNEINSLEKISSTEFTLAPREREYQFVKSKAPKRATHYQVDQLEGVFIHDSPVFRVTYYTKA